MCLIYFSGSSTLAPRFDHITVNSFKMRVAAIGFCLGLLAISAWPTTFATLTPSETFSGSASLVKDDVYHLFWKNDDTSITFEVHAKVKGWVGFGLSPNGGMPNSDIVIGWVKDGVSCFQVRQTFVSSNLLFRDYG